MIGLTGFVSDWSRKWREFSKPIATHSNAKREQTKLICSATQVKTETRLSQILPKRPPPNPRRKFSSNKTHETHLELALNKRYAERVLHFYAVRALHIDLCYSFTDLKIV